MQKFRENFLKESVPPSHANLKVEDMLCKLHTVA